MSDAIQFVPDEEPVAAAEMPAELDFIPDQPDPSAMKTLVKENVAKEKAAREPVDTSLKPVEAEDWLDSLAAGWGFSVSGLISGPPAIQNPEHAGTIMEVASQIGTLAGDLPAMAAGGMIGTMVGAPIGGTIGTAALPGLGTLGGIGAGASYGFMAGTFALPAGMRKVMMDHYEKGDITTGKEFFTRLSAATWETLKGGTVGFLTAGAGRYAGPVVGSLGKTVAEIGTMVTAGAALEGELPHAADFFNAGLIIGGFHGMAHVAPKFRAIYSKTGERPEAILEKASQDVQVKQDLLTANPDLPLSVADQKPLPKTKLEQAKDMFRNLIDDEQTADMPRTLYENKITEVTKDKWNSFYQQTVYSLDPIRAFVKDVTDGKLPASKNPETMMRLMADYQGKVQQAISEKGGGTLDFKTGKFNGESLETSLNRIKNEDGVALTEHETKVISRVAESDRSNKGATWSKFTSFLISKRALEKEAQGIKTGVDLDAAREVVKAGEGKYGQAAKEIQDFQKRMLKYAYDAGVLTKKSYEAMKEANKDYIPFHRLFEESEGGGRVGGKGQSLKKMTGSERELLDPIQAVYKNTEMIYRISEHNRAVNLMIEAAENSPKGKQYIKKVKGKTRPIEIKDVEVEKFMREQGFDTTDIPNEGFTVWRGLRQDLKSNEFAVFKNGERQVYETTPEIAEAINTMGQSAGMNNLFWKLATLPSKGLRAGVTLAPEFIARNFLRDQFTAGLQSKTGMIPFFDALNNVGTVFKRSGGAWNEFIASGGASGSFAEVARHVENNTWGTLKDTGHLSQAWGLIKTPFEALGAASTLAENVTRFTEFKKSGGVGGTLDQKAAGALAAREVTVDFSRMGANTILRHFNSLTPFFNVGIQGTDRMVRAFKENPERFMAMGAATITLPSILLWIHNRGDSRVQGAPNWEKNIYWHVGVDWWEKPANQADVDSRPEDQRRQRPDGSWEVNNGPVLKFPKPFVPGLLFGTVVERTLDRFVDQNPDAFDDLVESVYDSLKPNLMPAMLSGPLEQASNKSFFTGNQIVPGPLQRFTPEYRFLEYTSDTAKQIGKIIGHIPWVKDIGPDEAPLQSPAVIDNYIQVWTGGLGKLLVGISDAGLRAAGAGRDTGEAPTSTLSDIPVVKAFIARYPRANVQTVIDFQENYEKTSQVVATVDMLAKSGDFDAAMDLMKTQSLDFIKLNSFNDAISQQKKLIIQWNRDKGLSGSDKRQLIDTAYYQMQQIAIMGNNMLREHRKNLKKYEEKRED